MQIEGLYKNLRSMVKDKFEIQMSDRASWLRAVGIVTISDPNPSVIYWTRFTADTIRKALEKAIDKLANLEKDYVDFDGQVWPSDGGSIYDGEHLRRFLK